MANASIYTLLHQKLDALRALEIVQRHFNSTEEALLADEQRLIKLEKQLEKENRDIEKLEGLSVKNLFHKVLGDKQSQLEKERQEYLEMSLNYNELQKTIELKEYELSILTSKKEKLPGLEKEVKRLKKLREKEIAQSPSELGKQLRAVLEEHDSLIFARKEYQEAARVAEEIDDHLRAIIRHLEQAGGWGNWQQQRNRAYNQHRQIERARSLVSRSQHLLNILKKELSDININDFDVQISLESFSSFTTIFFDNLITDWIRQNKIRKTLNEIGSTKSSIIQLVKYLNQELVKMEKRMVKLSVKREEIVVSKKEI